MWARGLGLNGFRVEGASVWQAAGRDRDSCGASHDTLFAGVVRNLDEATPTFGGHHLWTMHASAGAGQLLRSFCQGARALAVELMLRRTEKRARKARRRRWARLLHSACGCAFTNPPGVAEHTLQSDHVVCSTASGKSRGFASHEFCFVHFRVWH